ncbi:hypothetical protein [Pseudoalteromonas sp. T1lg23B]|nr:hypothetical protein [Pseudoalteromonas sp. T1lg23B]
MNLKLKKKLIKSLSKDDKQLPRDATKQIGGGASLIRWPTDYWMCGEPD